MIARPALLPLFALFLALALVTILGSGKAHAQITFDPEFSACLDNALTGTECDGTGNTGAADDILAKTNIAAPNSNFGGLVGFISPDFTVATDAEIPDGAVTSTLFTVATLGLLNGPCNAATVVDFVMVDGTVNTGNTIAPAADNSLDAYMEDSDGNGIFDAADKYPSYLNETFPNADPIARQVGTVEVSGTAVVLNFMIFEPGANISDEITVDPSLGYPSVTVLQNPEAPPTQSAISDFCTPLVTDLFTFGTTRDNPCTPAGALPGCPGQPRLACSNADNDDPADDVKVNDGCPQRGDVAESGAECDNSVSDDPEDAIVNDGCPTSGSIPEFLIPDPDGCDTDNNEASCVYRANPAADGTYNFVTFAASQFDADGDGIENSLDPCPYDATTDWDPRAPNPTSDADNDGLPSACDPDDSVASEPSAQTCPEGQTGGDEDEDCYSNRQDNCPLIANDLTDTDSDGIGDECDENPNVDDGTQIALCKVTQITVGAGGAAASTQVPPCSEAGVQQDDTTDGGDDTTDGGDDTTDGGTDGGGGTQTGGGAGGPATGVGSLAPAASSIPAWAAIASGLGLTGLLGGIGVFFSRIFGRLPRWPFRD